MLMHALSDLGVRSMADLLQHEATPADRLEYLKHVIEHASHLLPAQGPISVFIHHNTLHGFEDLAFDQGVQKGAEIFGNQPYLPEEKFREHLATGRIRTSDLQTVLAEDLGPRGNEPILLLGTRFELRMAMLQFPKWTAPEAELHWFVAQTDALTKLQPEVSAAVRERFLVETRHWVMRDLRRLSGETRPTAVHESLATLLESFGEARMEAWSDAKWESFALQSLWRVIREAVQDLAPPPSSGHIGSRPRDWLLAAGGQDCDALVNELLIRFCAAFLDQGISQWPLPRRDEGFFKSFAALYGRVGGPPDRWLLGLRAELRRIEAAGLTPLESIRESLERMGIEPEHWDDAIISSLLALRGWAGMIRQVEVRGDRVAHAAPAGSLVEYLAVRLVLERLAAEHVARHDLGHSGSLDHIKSTISSEPDANRPSADQRAFLIFQLAQDLGWCAGDLWKLTFNEWTLLVGEIESFTALERRRVFQKAFERRYCNQALDALTGQSKRSSGKVKRRFQLVCCLDEREESFRRHLEELAPDCETFGVAGFYAVAMYFRGAADAHFVPLCPVVIRPNHWVEENVDLSLESQHKQKARIRKALGEATHRLHVGTRSGPAGAILSTVVGALATIPLVARVLFPRLTSRIRRGANRLFQSPSHTQLQLERAHGEPGTEPGRLGFSVAEMTEIAERLLRDIGLTKEFAALVYLIGHGSNSVNNPHKSAYDCGACGGNAGGPNARAAAQILNDPRVRQNLSARGLMIPHETWFIGCFHNTCNDSITYFDLERVPDGHAQEFREIREILEKTCDRNAHERARRFQSAPLTLPFAAARRHVEARAEDLAQTRPECGHATNAICFVGRRERTRGLYMDRRAFLASYDPTQDDADRKILTRTLQAAVPVCAGINLEYYFSYIDSPGWGCGTKLPHNVTSLLGVMDGAASDLRPGLPWQMVEIHEPVRLLFIVETTPEAMLRILSENDGIGKLVRNEWVQMSVIDPASPTIHIYQNGCFVPYDPENEKTPEVKNSVDWYRGWRDHLGFATLYRASVN
jgi:uncharacterized protein YbcC (UPF0753/DUF2309 family)